MKKMERSKWIEKPKKVPARLDGTCPYEQVVFGETFRENA